MSDALEAENLFGVGADKENFDMPSLDSASSLSLVGQEVGGEQLGKRWSLRPRKVKSAQSSTKGPLKPTQPSEESLGNVPAAASTPVGSSARPSVEGTSAAPQPRQDGDPGAGDLNSSMSPCSCLQDSLGGECSAHVEG